MISVYLLLDCSARALSNGCKSRVSPNSGNYIAKGKDLEGMAENNLPHTVRCKSTKPPYAERHVRWCGWSVNVKVGGKCLL